MKSIEEQVKEAKTNMKIIGNYNLYLSKKYYKFIFYRRICVILAIFTFVAVIMLYTGKLIVPYLTFFKIIAGLSFWVLVILCAYFSKEKEDCLNSVATWVWKNWTYFQYRLCFKSWWRSYSTIFLWWLWTFLYTQKKEYN